MNLNQVTLPALDMLESVRFYKRIGFTQIVDAPHYARFECPDGDSTFSLHQVESVAPDTGVVLYFECMELDAKVTALKDDGFTFTTGPEDKRWLWREARLHDPSGNQICLFFAGSNRKHPPWRVT